MQQSPVSVLRDLITYANPRPPRVAVYTSQITDIGKSIWFTEKNPKKQPISVNRITDIGKSAYVPIISNIGKSFWLSDICKSTISDIIK